jgi:hypothetical protein
MTLDAIIVTRKTYMAIVATTIVMEREMTSPDIAPHRLAEITHIISRIITRDKMAAHFRIEISPTTAPPDKERLFNILCLLPGV